MIKRVVFFIAIIAYVFPGLVVAQNADTIAKTISSIEERIVLRDYTKAYSYALFLIRMHKNAPLEAASVAACENAVDFYSEDLFAKRRWDDLVAMGKDLSGAPLSVQRKAADRIAFAQTELVREAERAKIDESGGGAQPSPTVVERTVIVERQPEPRYSGKENARTEAIAADLEAAASDRAHARELLELIGKGLADMRDEVGSMRDRAFGAFVAAFAAFALSLAALAFVVVRYRSPTILPSAERHAVAGVLDVLSRRCMEVGAEIDAHTNRPGNSRKVAAVVRELALRLGYSEEESLVFSLAALIRDIGFLSVSSEAFRLGPWDDEARHALDAHVSGAHVPTACIPDPYRDVFRDAIANHHENADGTGYPIGLKGQKVPPVARIIRAAESFVALTSVRPYAAIMDAKSALVELRAAGKRYDQKTVDALEGFV